MPDTPELAPPTDGRLRILLVEDDEVDRMVVQRSLAEARLDAEVVSTRDLRSAQKELERRSLACAVVDFQLPDGDAFELLRRMAAGELAHYPVVVLTGVADEELGVRLLAAGAQDYLVKGEVTGHTLARAVRYAVERHRIQRELDAARARLDVLSHEDTLTGLLNRRGLERVLNAEVARSARNGQPLHALLIDCDDLKKINASFGYGVGDRALITVAECVRRATRSTDYAARIGGDEFLVLLPDSRPPAAVTCGQRICQEVNELALELPAGTLEISVSIGATPVSSSHDKPLQEILAAGHIALSRVKAEGKNRVTWAGSTERGNGVSPWNVDSLEQALATGAGFTVARQPFLDLDDREPLGYEILIRGPGEFERPEHLFEAARELDRLLEVDLDCARRCLEAADDLDLGYDVHVNLFPATLLRADRDVLSGIFGQFTAGRRVHVDLSNRWILGDPAELLGPLETLAGLGVDLALDHVGCGRSSLEALLLLNPRVIKTDPSLARSSSQALGRLRAIAESLGSRLIALGLENESDVVAAREAGVSCGQGFALGAPQPCNSRSL